MPDRKTAEYGARRRNLKGNAFLKWVKSNLDEDGTPPLNAKPDVKARKPRKIKTAKNA